MATQAQIDAAKAVLADVLDAKDASGNNVSLYNGGVVPKWNDLAARINGGVDAIKAVGVDPTQLITLLNGVVSGINPTGQEARRVSNAIAALTADPVVGPPADPPVIDPPAVDPTSTTITFTEGVPARISVAVLLPATADRYHGGWEVQENGYITDNHQFNWLPGVYFDPATKEMVYDGSPMSLNPHAVTPSVGYYVGAEQGPYNPHWSYPPVQEKTPAPVVVNGVTTVQSIYGGSKHTRAIFCPWDKTLRVYGGDYASYGLGTSMGGQDGRMLMWKVDLNTSPAKWSLDYPAKGRVGDQVPLQSDRMNMDADEARQVFWVAHGSVRPSPGGYYANNVLPAGDTHDYAGRKPVYYWKGDGGIAEAMPEHANDDNLPVFIYDPKGVTSFKAARLGANPLLTPWVQNNSCMMGTAFHQASKRWYGMMKSGNGVMLFWLDTTAYETAPDTLAWQSLQIDLRVGDPLNLSGVDHSLIYGPANTPMFVDESKLLMYFFDVSVAPALLAVTLPGHPQGAHKVLQIADLRAAVGNDFTTGQPYNISQRFTGLTSVTVSPFVWIPEHRCIVWMNEPDEENVGPWTRSMQIDVDTGAITEGPRYPNSNQDGMPYHPNTGVWFPPTGELVLFGLSIMTHSIVGGNRSWDSQTWSLDLEPTVWNRYKWVA